MATQKPISTISYNSRDFLLEKLNLWVEQHLIQTYQVIFHKGEDGDKDHAHVRIEPNKKLDPMDLTEKLKEFVLDNDKPLGVRPWRPSQEEDWFLYAVHDSQYLKLKYKSGEKGEKLPYKKEDIIVPDNYDLEIAFIRAKAKLEHTSAHLAERLHKGLDPYTLIQEGENVFTVNALSHALSGTPYLKLQDDFKDLSVKYDNLVALIKNEGYTIITDKDKKVRLHKL